MSDVFHSLWRNPWHSVVFDGMFDWPDDDSASLSQAGFITPIIGLRFLGRI
jgi:hypothetical protein